MSWPSLLLTFGSIFAMACGASSPSTPAEQAEGIVLAPGESARLSALRVTFDGVSADSRCPVDVVCVWEGDAVVDVTLSHPQGTERRELHTSGATSLSYQGLVVELVRLDPAPRSTQPIPPGSYRLVLRLSPVF